MDLNHLHPCPGILPFLPGTARRPCLRGRDFRIAPLSQPSTGNSASFIQSCFPISTRHGSEAVPTWARFPYRASFPAFNRKPRQLHPVMLPDIYQARFGGRAYVGAISISRLFPRHGPESPPSLSSHASRYLPGTARRPCLRRRDFHIAPIHCSCRNRKS
jgi:hypothetical protein